MGDLGAGGLDLVAAGRRFALIEAIAAAMIDHAEELSALDQAIGDGDHGHNMRRGFAAVRADAAMLGAKPLPEAMQAIGTQLVLTIGGAAGPLYGTLFLAWAKGLGAGSAEPFAEAVAAVKARGRSEAGQKTLLDVLVPVQAAVAAGGADLLDRLPSIADQAAAATIPMRATCGRAAFLGERSIGHMDPGARSAALMIAAACRVLRG